MGYDISNESFQRLGDTWVTDNLNTLADGWMLDGFRLMHPYLLNVAEVDGLSLRSVEYNDSGMKLYLLYDVHPKPTVRRVYDVE